MLKNALKMNINSYTEMKLTINKIITLMILFFVLTINNNVLQAQTSSNQSSSAFLYKADIAYHNMNYSIAADYYEKYLQKPAASSKDALTKLADCYWQMRQYDNALKVYKLLYPMGNESASITEQIHISELFARNGEYQQASEWLKGISGYEQKCKMYSKRSALDRMKKDSTNWKVTYLNTNTKYREFSPFKLNNTLFFSSNKPVIAKAKAFEWDGNNFVRLWKIPVSSVDSGLIVPKDETLFAKKKTKTTNSLAGLYEYGDSKQKSDAANVLVNQSYIDGDLKPIGSIVKGLDKVHFNAGAISIDKNNHFYFSANYQKADKKGINRICLMEGLYDDSGVTKIHQLPFGDANSYSVMHPAINNEGTFLVFSSDKPNGKGGFDLYYTERKDVNRSWDSLKIIGSNINTAGNEVFPTITANGFLYYSSDATPGLGGLDIFRIPLTDILSGKGEPEHLSYPINSSGDDFGWTQDSTGTKGYFTSDRLNNDDNLYGFNYILTKQNEQLTPQAAANLPKEIKLPKKSFIEGFVVEKESLKPIEGATLFLYNKNSDKVFIAKTDELGKYRFPVVSNADITIKALENKYLSDCLNTSVTYELQPADTIQKASRNLFLDKFKVGFVWKLSNIHDFNKTIIRVDAKPILDSLIMILNTHPIVVELGSHTDSRGSATYNAKLSQHRADSAIEYLLQHGIDSKRITAKGYGESNLLNKCADGVQCSEEEHQANRRIEVKVTGYTTPQKEPANIDVNKFKAGEEIDKSSLPNTFSDECK